MYFSSISQEFSPINIEDSSPKVKMLLKDAEKQKKPVLEPYEVYHRINRSKKPKSTVQGIGKRPRQQQAPLVGLSFCYTKQKALKG